MTKALRMVGLDLGAARLCQAAAIQTVDIEARTVDVIFTTGEVIPHYMDTPRGCERVLTQVIVTPEAAMLEKIIGGPVLDAHDAYDARTVLGVVEAAWIAAGKGWATLRFSQAADVEPVWQKVAEGVLRNVSMGFNVHAAEPVIVEGPLGPQEIWNLTRWEPLEISMVAVGADSGAKVQAKMVGKTETFVEKGLSMTKNVTGADPQTAVMTAAADPVVAVTQAAADPAAILTAERGRVAEIQQAAVALNVAADMVGRAIAEGLGADVFRQQAIEAHAARAASHTAGIGGARAQVTQDASDRFRQGALLGLMRRGSMKGGERNEFTGMTLQEVARHSLQVSGATRSFGDRMEMIGAAFTQSAGSHHSSDFANILSSLMGKGALLGWEEAPETYQLFTKQGTLSDFKATSRVGAGLFDALPKIAEGAEYSYGTMGDRGEPIALATYGRLLKVTRQVIINDDLGLLTDAPRKMGRAARRTIGNLVYAILTGNPALSDGVVLFHADHGNLAGTAAAPSVAALSAARAAMRLQKEAAGGSALNIQPRYALVPASLETTMQQLMSSLVDPTANKGHATNPVSGMAEVVADARLDDASSTAWFLAGDPGVVDTIEVAFLDGNTEPFIEEKVGWSSDGVEVKVRIDAGVAPLDHRGLYKNAGA